MTQKSKDVYFVSYLFGGPKIVKGCATEYDKNFTPFDFTFVSIYDPDKPGQTTHTVWKYKEELFESEAEARLSLALKGITL